MNLPRIPTWVWLAVGVGAVLWLASRQRASAQARYTQLATPQPLAVSQLQPVAIPGVTLASSPVTSPPVTGDNVDPSAVMDFSLMGGA